MLINNPLEMNDWKYGQFIKLTIIIQFLVLILVGLNLEGFNVPVISQLIVFIYLTFIPGFLILRILRIHEVGSVRSILYSVGLSITSVMFIGFLTSTILPYFGISKPLSVLPLTIVVTVIVVILSVISYLRDGDFSSDCKFETQDLFTPSFIFLSIIPFVAIFGSYFITNYHTSVISMFLLILIALTFLLIVFDKIPKKMYAYTIWIVSISLLYVSSLISPFVWGWDIQNEYYLANLIINFSTWNYTLPDAYNSMLSIVMLAPTYSLLTYLRLDYILKIVYPFFFSLVPLGLYKIFKIQTKNSKIAFLAVFLFVSFNTFYIELLALSREMIAELFFVLLLLLLLNQKLRVKNIVLLLLFSMGLVVSHYSTTYFFILALVGASILMVLFRLSKFNISHEKITYGNKTIVLPLLTLFIIGFAYVWYSVFSQGLAIKAILDVVTFVKQDFFDLIKISLQNAGIVPTPLLYDAVIFLIVIAVLFIVYIVKIVLERSALSTEHHFLDWIVHKLRWMLNYKVLAIIGIVVLVVLTYFTGPPKTWIVTVLRYLNFTAVFFTVSGMVLVFLGMYKNKWHNTYLAFSIVAVVMLLSGFVVPSFEGAFNITRIYEITFIILSPFCVIGGMKILGSIYAVIARARFKDGHSIKIFSIFVLIFFLFNSGFVSELSGQSIPMFLSGENVLSSDYYPLFDYQEADSAQWLVENNLSSSIYADVYGKFMFYRYTPNINNISANNGISEFTPYNASNTYMYLRTLNVNNGYLVGFTSRTDRNRVYKDLSSNADLKNRIFDDGGSRIYYS